MDAKRIILEEKEKELNDREAKLDDNMIDQEVRECVLNLRKDALDLKEQQLKTWQIRLELNEIKEGTKQ